MPLPLQDALLLTLVVGSVCMLIAGDLSPYLRDLPVLHHLRALWAAPSLWRRARAAAPRPLHALAALPPLAADLLVVDDSAVARAKLRRLLEGDGYKVQLARDGVEALALLEQGRYAMMITDLEMPNMDGVALIHACLQRPQTANMPIIAVSAHENLRAKFNACRDICGVHRKPWVDDLLLSHVATQIGTRARVAVPASPRLRTTA